MKKIKTFLSVIAFMTAITFAFAFSFAPPAEDPAWIDFSPNPDLCRRAPGVVCGGGSELCEKNVTGAGGIVQIYQFDNTADCNGHLQME